MRPYRAAEADKNYLSVLQKFVKEYQYSLIQEAAAALSLSVVIRDGKEEYFFAVRNDNKAFEYILSKIMIRFPSVLTIFKNARLGYSADAQTLPLKFSRILTDKIIISPNSKAELDFSDNL